MPNDLIYRREALANLLKQPLLTRSILRRVLYQTTTIDAAEVVRCEKCRYCIDGVCLHPKNRIAIKVPDFGKHYAYMADLKVPQDHFCSYGERRADDGK